MKLSNVVWNFIGLGLPVIAGIATIPLLLSAIGLERFGVLSIAWGLLGFAGVFDLGIGRSATRALSSAIGARKFSTIPGIIKTTRRLSLTSGAVGAVVFSVSIALGAHTLLNYSSSLEEEIKYAAYVLAITIPTQALSAMYRGVSEAHGNFRGVSIVRAVSNSATFLFPLAVSEISSNCASLVFSLLVSRLFALLAYQYLASKSVAENHQIQGSEGLDDLKTTDINSKDLLRFGSWFTLSSILYPVMGQLDRLFIGSHLSVSEVATYTIPFDLIMQLLIIPGAITTVLFPTLTRLANTDFKRSEKIFLKWLLTSVIIMTSVIIFALYFLPSALEYWLKTSLGREAIQASKIVLISLIPFTLGTFFVVQAHARNRPEIPALSHLVQFLIFTPIAYFSIDQLGLIGAALTWTMRVTFDATVLMIWYVFARRIALKGV